MKTSTDSFTSPHGLSFNEFCQREHMGNITPEQREMVALIIKNCPTAKDVLSFKNYFSQKTTAQNFALKAYTNTIIKLAVAYRKHYPTAPKKCEVGIRAFPHIIKQQLCMNILNHLPY